MSAFTLLKADRKKVADLLEQIDSTTERGIRTLSEEDLQTLDSRLEKAKQEQRAAKSA